MKTCGKKILATLLALALIISVIPEMAYAADTTNSTEADNNDVPTSATSLTASGVVAGIISSEDDVDYYKYIVDVSGYFSFTFTNTSAKECAWDVSVSDASLNELESWKHNGYTYTSQTYNFMKGTTVYVKVVNRYDTIGLGYTLAVNAKTDANWEQENNDTKGTATIIRTGITEHGNSFIDNDVDYYQYKVDVSGYFNITMTNINALDCAWDVTLYDSSLSELEYWKQDGYTHTSHTYNFKKGTVVYLKVTHRYDAVGQEYIINVNAKKKKDWEQEKNDSYSKAITLKANAIKYGNLYISDDIDYYSYTAAKTGTLKTTFKFDADDVGYGWKVLIYDSSKNEIMAVSDITTDKTISFKATKGKKYYVVVRAESDYSCPTGITYALKIK